jgi:hypothetical protein
LGIPLATDGFKTMNEKYLTEILKISITPKEFLKKIFRDSSSVV